MPLLLPTDEAVNHAEYHGERLKGLVTPFRGLLSCLLFGISDVERQRACRWALSVRHKSTSASDGSPRQRSGATARYSRVDVLSEGPSTAILCGALCSQA